MPLIHHPLPSSPPNHSSITIQLDSPDLVLRALSGNEASGQSASLTGTVQLQLSESTHLKDLSLNLRSIAKIDYLEPLSGKRFHHLHPIFFHQFSFLPFNLNSSDSNHHQPSNPSTPSHHGSQSTTTTTTTTTYTTLQAGLHRFPFSINLPSDLPASLRTYSGSGLIYYKLKAIATRAGFLTHSKWETKQILRVARSFPVEAVEWNQTLEIENTWPGKVSYEISLPHKAFAAGDRIPVSLKFSPLMKGVRVTSLVTTIKEHVALVGKAGTPPHIENRDVAQCRFEFTDKKAGGSAPLSRADPSQTSTNPSNLPRRHLSSSDLTLLTSRLNAVSLSNRRPSFSTLPSPSRSVFGNASSSTTPLAELAPSEELRASLTADVELSQDIDTIIELTIPSWTTPSHSLPPITVTHKLKFSAFIINPDGHTSELRCALPLHILASHLASEASIASAGARTLLFDPSGNLSQGFNQSVELPSYPEHVRDRLASQEQTHPMASVIPAPWITSNTPGSTPPVSRPASPSASSTSNQQVLGYFPEPGSIPSPSPAWTPSHDTEFIRSLDASPTYFNPIHQTPLHTSNNSSRASSPGLGTTNEPPSGSGSSSGFNVSQLATSTSSTSSTSSTTIGNGFFQIHLPKIPHRNRAPKALTAMRNTNGSGPSSASSSNLVAGNGHGHAHSSSTTSLSGSLPTPVPETERELMSRVPSYSIASRGSLGGGPVPISSLIGLPSYEESSAAINSVSIDHHLQSRRNSLSDS
ncbi:uncharacterized protein MELLADRAFT_93509 [Melampsora larici-populina 98AG31]|uniref:Arrestin C-terminal-like domain-containing protein n=1 Tax=Melampsora larici-populina (strain 98AG31 / pathotype 3-4-7) TaxID=747676 RepID=F4RAN4_MELLP|nr:uncharacterized protein MELLADRAFT_93509 [Melampsora larici-populina 98AG31]EGG10754.1 hypothetical protein MELLADRAFT_93509 [Melampsora larici-populina 98AG31]